MNERLEATIRGRVQMVMFRDFVQRKSSALRLCGKVQNKADGTVRVVAEGPREKLELLLAKLHKGPLLARVESVEPTWLKATNEFSTFVISYES
jgi:acylphosphatase